MHVSHSAISVDLALSGIQYTMFRYADEHP